MGPGNIVLDIGCDLRYAKMGYAGNNDPQFIIPSAIATKETPTAGSRSTNSSSIQKKGTCTTFNDFY